MAKLFFVGLDGTEKSYRLQTHRPFTVGRDPGNDIILRDPKVSRHHAEIVFERGFFVVHDLTSANGTYINGKRIRVAPLTHGQSAHGQHVRTILRGAADGERWRAPRPSRSSSRCRSAADDLFAQMEAMPTSTLERFNLSTQPHEQMSPADLKKKRSSG